MAARGRIRAKREQSTSYQGLDAPEECNESTALGIHAFIELEKDDFISLEECGKRSKTTICPSGLFHLDAAWIRSMIKGITA